MPNSPFSTSEQVDYSKEICTKCGQPGATMRPQQCVTCWKRDNPYFPEYWEARPIRNFYRKRRLWINSGAIGTIILTLSWMFH